MRVTVGLSPGSRHIGIAVLHKKRLITWRVHTFKGKWSQHKEDAIIEAIQKLFASYDVAAVSVKIPDLFPDSLAFSQVLGIINNLCEREGIKSEYRTLSQIKEQFSNNPKVNKEAIIAHLAHQYPELRPEYQKEQRKRSRYYVRIFEAVAAGLCT